MVESTVTVVLGGVFWGAAGLLGYTYVVYPMLLEVLGRGKRLPEQEEEGGLPEVAVLMAVYNEENVIEHTLESILASDYPMEKVRILIGSDGSTDRSHEMIESFREQHPGLNLRIFSGRNGKIRIINQLAQDAEAGFEDAESAVFVLCDANVAWSSQALANMVGHLRRDSVGLVGSSVMDQQEVHEGIGDEEEAYVGRENRTKFYEGVLWGKMMGAFGACYAMKAKLFTPVPEHYIVDDFFQTMACLEGGHEAIVDLDAEVYEAVSVKIEEEFRRKTRIATGNFQNLKHFWNLLMPWGGDLEMSHAFWAHKGLRWFGPHLLIVMSVAAVALAWIQPIYLLAVLGIAGSGVVSAFDYWTSLNPQRPHIKLFRFVRYFYAMNYAVWRGFLAFLRGGQNSVWEPTMRVEHDRPEKAQVKREEPVVK